ncbi:Com family DNA-binding transcriptional regulator [Pseudophaeobacter arcticus]|uniref:Com family DNA-binding transcriptional regulator n=1 Tax=Pseudophaeobacter arcticus TaxID=385492 RepID=UPI003A9876A1
MTLQDQRCGECRRLLFKIEPGALSGALSIKCPRCKAHNTLRPQSPSPERQERDGTEGQSAQIIRDRPPATRARLPRRAQGEPL